MTLGGVPTALPKSPGTILTALTDCPFKCHPFRVLFLMFFARGCVLSVKNIML